VKRFRQGGLISGAVLNGAAGLVPLCVTLVTVPLLVGALGLRQFGVYALASTVTTYVSLGDLGLGDAIVRFVGASESAGDRPAAGRVVSTAVLYYLILGVVAGGAIFWLGPELASLFRVGGSLRVAAADVFRISGISLPAAMLWACYARVPEALQRYDISSALVAANATFGAIAPAAAALLTHSVVWAVAAGAVTTVALALVTCTVAALLLRGASILPRLDRVSGRALFGFSAFSFAWRLSYVITAQLDRVVIGTLLGPAAVALYTVPATTAMRVQGLLSRLAYVLFPAVSRHRGDLEDLRRLYESALRVMLALGLAVSVPLFLCHRQLLVGWVGPAYAGEATRVFAILIAAYLLMTISVVPYSFSTGVGRPAPNAMFALCGAALNAAAIYPAVHFLGIEGAALSVMLSFAPVPSGAAWIQSRVLGLTSRAVLRRSVLPPFALAALALPLQLGLLWLVSPKGLAAAALVAAGGVALGAGIQAPFLRTARLELIRWRRAPFPSAIAT
jgi:O-antigen/teichoic acid export membrane protein